MRKIVLNTNVFLVCISSKSKLHWIYRCLIENQFTLCVTTNILLEYAEIIDKYMGRKASENALGLLQNLTNLVLVTSCFKFNLLSDPDDNRFVDCAIAANADFIISHDKDFKILKKIEFPKVTLIDTVAFATYLQ